MVVSQVNTEPPLHPDGPEKILQDFGIEPEEFDELGLDGLNEDKKTGDDKLTEGIFTLVHIKEDFYAIGGQLILYTLHNPKRTLISLIGFNWLVMRQYRHGKGSYTI